MIQKIKTAGILVCSWGYEQTNVDFYLVLDIKGQTITLQEIGLKTVEHEGNGMACTVLPDPSIKVGEPLKKRVSQYGVKINSYATARPFNGVAKYCSWYA